MRACSSLCLQTCGLASKGFAGCDITGMYYYPRKFSANTLSNTSLIHNALINILGINEVLLKGV